MASLDHARRIDTVRAMVRDLAERAHTDGAATVPNTPAWTVGDVATHVAWALTFWRHMMDSSPSDATARDRALAETPPFPPGLAPDDLMARIEPILGFLAEDEDAECYVSMTGGPGTRGVWARHALSEIAVHQMDVQSALGIDPTLDPEAAADAVGYVASAVLPAFRRFTGEDPGPLRIELTDAADQDPITVASGAAASPPTVRGPGRQILLALWGRPHAGVEVVDGDAGLWAGWRALPTRAFQFADPN